MKLHAKAGKRTARVLSIALSVMLIVTLIPIREIGRVYAEPNDDTDEYCKNTLLHVCFQHNFFPL